MKQQKNTSFTLTMNSHTGKTSSEELINRTKKMIERGTLLFK